MKISVGDKMEQIKVILGLTFYAIIGIAFFAWVFFFSEYIVPIILGVGVLIVLLNSIFGFGKK